METGEIRGTHSPQILQAQRKPPDVFNHWDPVRSVREPCLFLLSRSIDLYSLIASQLCYGWTLQTSYLTERFLESSQSIACSYETMRSDLAQRVRHCPSERRSYQAGAFPRCAIRHHQAPWYPCHPLVTVSASFVYAFFNSSVHALFWLVLAREGSPVLDHTPSFQSNSTLTALLSTLMNVIGPPPHPNPTWSACSACVCKWTWTFLAPHPTPTLAQDMMSVYWLCALGNMNVLGTAPHPLCVQMNQNCVRRWVKFIIKSVCTGESNLSAQMSSWPLWTTVSIPHLSCKGWRTLGKLKSGRHPGRTNWQFLSGWPVTELR